MKRQNRNGITLIALVVTIVILLILAGITIATLFGENGIIKTAEIAKEEHRGATVKEQRDLWKTDKLLNEVTAKTLNELVQELINNRLVTEDEGNTILDIGIITIGSHVIDFRDEEESVDLTGMAPGLYETGTKNMIYSWEELKNDGNITVEGSTLTSANAELNGELVISNEITIIGSSLRGSPCAPTDSKIAKVWLSDTVKEISNYAFVCFYNLEQIIIPEGVTSIGEYAFKDCPLTKIVIPSSVTKISNSSFESTRVASIKVDTKNPTYDSRNNCNAIIETATNKLIIGCSNTIIPNTVTTIGDSAFEDCQNLKNINIPNSIINIERNAFYRCNNLSKITISSGKVNIGEYAFSGCENLSNIVMDGVSSIKQGAFAGCDNLKSITISANTTSIEAEAFAECINLTSIQIDTENPVYDSRNNCNAIIETATNKIVQGCINTIIPNTVVTIGEKAFSRCRNLKNLIIPNSIISIEANAFADCRDLSTMTISNSVRSIGKNAFMQCISLSNITIPNSVIEMQDFVFWGWTSSQTINVQFKQNELPSGWLNTWKIFCEANINYLQ